MARQFARFLLVGCANSTIGVFAILLLKWGLAFGDIAANAVGYALGLTVSFLLNRSWTFAHAGPLQSAVARFIVSFAIAYAANLATVLTLIESFQVNSYAAQAIGIVPYTGLFFVLSRGFVFQQAKGA